MLVEPIIEKLMQMKMHGMAEGLKQRLTHSDHADITHADMVGLLVDDEWTHREKRRIGMLLKLACFKDPACIEDIDYRKDRNLKKTTVLELAKKEWIEAKQNLVFTGPTGAGKSYLAQAIGQKACRDGISTSYFRMSKFLEKLKNARIDGSYQTFLKRLVRTRVLILDDFGVDLIQPQTIRDFLEVLDDRLGVGSVIIATQLPVSHWHEYLTGGVIADSICDRLLSNCQRIELASKESMRRKPSLTKTEDIAQAEKEEVRQAN